MALLEFENIKAFRSMEGQALPVGDWITITQDMINDFASATLDFQWIHTDIERIKKESPFKVPIAHGFMSVGMLSKLIEDAILVKSATMGVNYGLNKVRFPAPVPVNSEIRLAGSVGRIEDQGENGIKIIWNCTVELKGSEKPACVAEFISLLFE